jgi:hypothetical protein
MVKQYMEGGVVVLLDALGVKNAYRGEPTEVLQRRWNLVDRKLIRVMNLLKGKLKENPYNYSIRIQQPYDNVQIFLPFDAPNHRYTYISTRTPEWYSLQHIGEILVPFFRYALCHNIYFRGCISAGEYFLTRKRVFGPAVDEAAEYCENANWLGIMASPRTIRVLDTPDADTQNWFRIFAKYRVPLNIKKDGHISERKKWSWVLRWNIPRHEYVMDKSVTNKTIENILGEEVSNAKKHLELASKNCKGDSYKLEELTRINKKWDNTLEFFNRIYT